MSDVTRILQQIETGDPSASSELLPLVYDELRRLAAARLAAEKPGQTLQPTALVHEAYVRLIDQQDEPRWNHRGHFFSAAAEAMRRILVENARRKKRIKRGGDEWTRADLDPQEIVQPDRREDLLALDEALDRLATYHPRKAELIKLRYFGGLTMPQSAKALGISLSTAEREWRYARVWLLRELSGGDA